MNAMLTLKLLARFGVDLNIFVLFNYAACVVIVLAVGTAIDIIDTRFKGRAIVIDIGVNA